MPLFQQHAKHAPAQRRGLCLRQHGAYGARSASSAIRLSIVAASRARVRLRHRINKALAACAAHVTA